MADHSSDTPPPLPALLPVLPLRGVVVFPRAVAPLFVGRERSIAALDAAIEREDRVVVLVTQVNARTNEPSARDLYDVGTLACVTQVMRMPDETVKVSVQGEERVRILELVDDGGHLKARIEIVPDAIAEQDAVTELQERVRTAFAAFAGLQRRIPTDVVQNVVGIEDPGHLADMVAAHLGLKVPDRQAVLALHEIGARLARLAELIEAEAEVARVERRLRKKVSGDAADADAAQAAGEQNDGDEFKNELDELGRSIAEKDLTEEARSRLDREFRKLKMMNPMSAEAGVLRTYIDWVLALPWADRSEDVLDIPAAREVLEADHYGLEKPKARILEYLAVQKLVERLRGPVLCLVGPPGVGKTSLARSIATSTGRRFVRLSLGGVRDEAEIRGHRRTYIGALPGKVIQSLKKVGSNNPVFLLDEIDKMSMDFRGDPASALLEVLDPEQNDSFVDHYLDLDYDLSSVLFIATANFLQNIPIALADRLEIIELGGYTEPEKLAIAKRYLVPRQQKENGLAEVDLKVADDALKLLIRSYTREAGVRSLERQIGAVCRKLATEQLEAKRARKRLRVDPDRVRTLLGAEKYKDKRSESEDRVGIVNGLAVTSVGGDLLDVEVAVVPGSGRLTFTGKLGDVMQESVQAAMSYVRSRAEALGLDRSFYQKIDVHVHFPEGAIAKDGPSAGIAIATGLVSALTGLRVRHDVAMTGEITLRGRVLAIGGLKEKVIAAHRAGLTFCLVPEENRRNLEDIPAEVQKGIEIRFVAHADEALRAALVLRDPDAFLTLPQTYGGEALGIAAEGAAVAH
ncbi:MAG: endopeptidase La [Deltaproteobacteria bacterium]|nr:endopeptidase La [Deltaproteobacteria bacterium]